MLTSYPDGFATQNNLATDTVGYGMYDAGKRNGTKPWEYKTLAKLEADDTGVTITRPVQAYITSAFKKKWGWSVASDGDGFVHVFATYGSNEDGTTNLYAAKVRWDEIEDTSKVSTLVSSQSSHLHFPSSSPSLFILWCPSHTLLCDQC